MRQFTVYDVASPRPTSYVSPFTVPPSTRHDEKRRDSLGACFLLPHTLFITFTTLQMKLTSFFRTTIGSYSGLSGMRWRN